MNLPPDFAFSQKNLQDFIDCPRRFELRYLLKLAWPAVRTEPYLEVERHMLLGDRFHRMVQQHQTGLPAGQIEATASEPELLTWWQAYQNNPLPNLPQRRLVEYTLAASFGKYRLEAKYDLLAVQPGEHVVIVDWKTALRKPHRAALHKRMQTRLYPFLLLLAGNHLNGGVPLVPEQVEMVYWFTADPHNPEHFPYNQAQFDADREMLQKLIAEIEAAAESGFALTEDLRMCRFCNYRSLCERGEQAASLDEDFESDETESLTGFDIDFEHINEIEF